MEKAKRYDVLILGGGAAGLMAAGLLRGGHVAVLEGNARIGEKIRISGGGRCNVTNALLSYANYLGDPDFIAPVLESYGNQDLLDFLAGHGCLPVRRKENQYFCPKSSEELLEVLRARIAKVSLYTGTRILSVAYEGFFKVATSRGDFFADKVIVATGGLSYAKIGATGIGYEIARTFGHAVATPAPALVGLTLQPDAFWMKELSGVSIPVGATVGAKRLQGDLLFAHKGISGPVILNASLYWQKGTVLLDFLPEFSLSDLPAGSNKQLSTLLPLPRRLARTLLNVLQIEDRACRDLSKGTLEKLAVLKAYCFAPAGTFGFARAEVTKGGVQTDAIDPKTMQSRLRPSLYFIGEVLDVTGELGGYNFQWAFSSAVNCARAIA